MSWENQMRSQKTFTFCITSERHYKIRNYNFLVQRINKPDKTLIKF